MSNEKRKLVFINSTLKLSNINHTDSSDNKLEHTWSYEYKKTHKETKSCNANFHIERFSSVLFVALY